MDAIPDELTYLLQTNVPAHVSLTEADGSIVTHVMWVDFDGEHILTSSPSASYKSRALRARPQVAVSVVDPADPLAASIDQWARHGGAHPVGGDQRRSRVPHRARRLRGTTLNRRAAKG